MFNWVLNTPLVKTAKMTLQVEMGWKIESNWQDIISWEDIFSSATCFWYYKKSSNLIIFKFQFFFLKTET